MKHNKRFFSIITLMVFFYQINAQISVGIKVGANIADSRVDGLIGNYAPEPTTFPGYTVGLTAELPGFTVSQSFDVDVLGIEMPLGAKARTRINYLELPLLLKYSVGSELAKAYFIAGPNVAYAVNAELRPVASLLIDINLPRVNINLNNDIYQRWEISGVLGAGGEIKAGNGKLFADARYNLGFTNMLDNPLVDLRIKNQGFNVSAGYAHVF